MRNVTDYNEESNNNPPPRSVMNTQSLKDGLRNFIQKETKKPSQHEQADQISVSDLPESFTTPRTPVTPTTNRSVEDSNQRTQSTSTGKPDRSQKLLKKKRVTIEDRTEFEFEPGDCAKTYMVLSIIESITKQNKVIYTLVMNPHIWFIGAPLAAALVFSNHPRLDPVKKYRMLIVYLFISYSLIFILSIFPTLSYR